jgi:dodecin
MTTVKVIEVIGSSPDSWEGAVQNAVKSAARTLRELVGADVKAWTAKIGPDGEITEFHATVKIAFKVLEGDEE